MARIQLTIDEHLYQHVKRYCLLNGITVSDLMRQAVKDSTAYGRVAISIKTFPIADRLVASADAYEVV